MIIIIIIIIIINNRYNTNNNNNNNFSITSFHISIIYNNKISILCNIPILAA